MRLGVALMRWLNARVDRLVAWGLIREKTAPDNATLMTVLALMVMIATGRLWMPEWLWVGVLSAMAGGFAASPIGRRLAYSRGYHAGRMSWWISMEEAQRRGLPPSEWVELEAERDGLPTRPADPPSG